MVKAVIVNICLLKEYQIDYHKFIYWTNHKHWKYFILYLNHLCNWSRCMGILGLIRVVCVLMKKVKLRYGLIIILDWVCLLLILIIGNIHLVRLLWIIWCKLLVWLRRNALIQVYWEILLRKLTKIKLKIINKLLKRS
jgi:hypothetical protein